MADYHSLLVRAVGALPQSTPETRRAIYERARKALLGQLRLLDPPAAESDIARESAALDAAIARLESELLPPLAPEPWTPPPPAKPAAEAPAREAAPPARAPNGRFHAAPAASPANSRARPRRLRNFALGALVAVVVAGVATAAYVLPNPPFDKEKAKPVAAAVPKPTDPKAAKIIERAGNAGAPVEPKPASAPAPVAVPPIAAQADPAPPVPPAPVAPTPPAVAAAAPNPPLPVEQRAALLLQIPGDAKAHKDFVGTVVWRTDNISRGPGQPVQPAVRADIDIPEARLKASVIFQNNLDEAFSASHTMQVRFTLGPDNPAGGFKAIGMPEMREEGADGGVALAGAPQPIKENFFLIALAQGSAVVARNQDLMRTRAWLDMPLLSTDGRLAKIAIEKGPAGERMINDAFAAWKK